MKYIKQLSLTLLLLITAAAGAWAQGPWTSGSCTLTLNNGTLTVSGNGAMADYQFFSDRPWHNNRSDITSVVVESGVTTVGRYAFFQFTNMTSVTLPEGLTAIGVSAFRVCGKLTSVTIPSTVTSIGTDAFYYCNAMTDVNLYADPANLTWDEKGCDDFKENKATQCHVLAEHLSAYQTKFNGLVNVTFVGDLQPLTPAGPVVNLNDNKTTATMTMPANDVTVNYTLVRDMQDQANPVAFTGLPTTTGGSIIVKKGSDGKYQPAEELNIQLIDPLAAEDAKNIIAADGITIKVLVGNGGTPIEYDQENPITLEAFLADMKPGYYWIKAEATDENSPYEGTIYSSEFTVVEQYDLTVKPANDFSKGKIENVTVGSESIAPNADGKASKTGVAPNTDVKIKAKRGYIIEKVEAKKTVITMLNAATTENIGMVVCNKGHLHDAKTAVPAGCTAVGILGKVTETGHGLILALKSATAQEWNTINGWNSASYAGTTLKVLPDDAARGSLTSYTALGEIAVSNWAVAQKSDYEAIFTNLGSTKSDNDGTIYDGNVNAYITGAGGTALSALEGYYWSATEKNGERAWLILSNWWGTDFKWSSYSVRPVLGF